jgi:hypothetical protein
MSSERQVYVLYSVEFSSRILLPEVFGQCVSKAVLSQWLWHKETSRLKGNRKLIAKKIIIGYLTHKIVKNNWITEIITSLFKWLKNQLACSVQIRNSQRLSPCSAWGQSPESQPLLQSACNWIGNEYIRNLMSENDATLCCYVTVNPETVLSISGASYYCTVYI